MASNFDTNVSNYSITELMAIIGLDEFDPDKIIDSTNYYISKYNNKNPQLAVFFKNVQSQLLQYAQGLEEDDNNSDDFNEVDSRDKINVIEGFGNINGDAIYPAGDRQITDWYQNEVLEQNDKNQSNKITDRKQKVQLFGNDKVPMKQEQIATTDTFNLPVKQDSLNPNLKNTINRFINLDSQFRQYTSGIDSMSTDYTCDLSDTIKNALSLSLYSYQIPFSWYAIDPAYGNTCLWIYDIKTNINVPVSVPAGNYSQAGFQTALNTAFDKAGFGDYPIVPDGITAPVDYNANSGIITLYLYTAKWTDPKKKSNGVVFTINEYTQIIFYDFTGILQCNTNCLSKSNHYFNSTLGWIMGYRMPYYSIDPSGNTAQCILDLNGTKYLILVIDDYNQNHVNNSLVSISQFSNTLKIPSYYSPDLPYICTNPVQQSNNLKKLMDELSIQENTENGLLLAGKFNQDYTKTQVMLPSAPRTLTNAQLYTINSINDNNNNLTNYLAKAPTSSDILAIIPVKTSVGVPTGSLLVEFSGSLQDSTRTYFGPVNIERMAVKLLNDKGNILNLNGNDWCVSLIAECLYQY